MEGWRITTHKPEPFSPPPGISAPGAEILGTIYRPDGQVEGELVRLANGARVCAKDGHLFCLRREVGLAAAIAEDAGCFDGGARERFMADRGY